MVGQKWACVGGLTIAAAFLSTLVLIPVTPHALQTGLFAAKAGISVAFSAIYPWTSALFAELVRILTKASPITTKASSIITTHAAPLCCDSYLQIISDRLRVIAGGGWRWGPAPRRVGSAGCWRQC